MNTTQVLKQLESLGTAQARKIYGRHGVTGPAFGVSYAELGKLKKKLAPDHDLAVGLWKSGNHDARILATMIADPEALTTRQVDGWAKDLDNYVLTDAFAGLAAGSPHGPGRMRKWMASRSEWVAAAGWTVLAHCCGAGSDIADGDLGAHLVEIEERIHSAPNRVRYAMNNALISIGVRGATLQKKAVAAAKRIGRVEVDHGETGCKTPDAAAYIQKAVGHRREVQARRSAKKKPVKKSAKKAPKTRTR